MLLRNTLHGHSFFRSSLTSVGLDDMCERDLALPTTPSSRFAPCVFCFHCHLSLHRCSSHRSTAVLPIRRLWLPTPAPIVRTAFVLAPLSTARLFLSRSLHRPQSRHVLALHSIEVRAELSSASLVRGHDPRLLFV